MVTTNVLAQIAEDYYLNKKSFGQIAEKYDLSRYLINKYLNEAVKTGVVKIEITALASRNPQLEQVFKEEFPQTNCYIIQDSTTSTATEESLSKYAANLLVKHLLDNDHIVGAAWGDTMLSLVESISTAPLDQIKFTQFIGDNMKYNSMAGAMPIVEKAAKKVAGEFLTLPAPLYLANDDLRQNLTQEPSLANTLNMAAKMDTLITGIGTLASLQSIPIWHDHMDQLFPNLASKQIAGMIYGRPFDSQGRILNPNQDKVFGLSLDHILQVPKRICLVRSKSKSQATLGVLRAGLVTDLIFSESLAYRILNENDYI
ncbi:sugar-binding transcriptional regulator [Convivina praedatoris]|uniref:Sorbitol operon regulator n=1 Tax=Convivina praedatoris TaxID=2880963 RepID=A0ABM9D291_9LACO|nr:sugar-binding domain-containing protein [Convivina sp. LMG 32447]CAH1853689.1 Sorbitol operon regulator [Convivina sp. LMG 32447]CAH1855147.1 Sorbitol operon regulator [Convivina sp. LMG 32447]